MILTLWLIFVFLVFKYYRPTKPKHKAPPGLTPQQIERNRKQAEQFVIDETGVKNYFDNGVNSFEYYNCINSETGKYAAFYVEVKQC